MGTYWRPLPAKGRTAAGRQMPRLRAEGVRIGLRRATGLLPHPHRWLAIMPSAPGPPMALLVIADGNVIMRLCAPMRLFLPHQERPIFKDVIED